MKTFILNNAHWVKTWFTKSYPISLDFIARHEDNIDWYLLSKNKKIDYTIEFCEKYRERLYWEEFNPLLSREFKGEGRDERLIAFLDSFREQLNWKIVTENLRTPENTERLLRAFEDYWDWGNLCLVESIRWNLDLLRKFKDKIVWHAISVNNQVPWRYEWIEEFADLFDWYWFPHYSSYTWDSRSLQRFRKYLEEAGTVINSISFKNWLQEMLNDDMDEQSEDSGEEDIYDPVADEEFEMEGDTASLEEVIDKAGEQTAEGREIDFSYEHLNLQTFSYLMNLEGVDKIKLASDSIMTEPVEILRKFRDSLVWGVHCKQKSVDENGKPIEVPDVDGVCANGFILWTEEMMDEFEEKIKWDILGICGRIKWTKGIVEKHFHKFDKNQLLKKDAFFHKLILPEMNGNMWELVFGVSVG